MNRHTIFLGALTAITLAAAPAAFAQGRRMTTDAPAQADLTMAQAVVIAESMGNGRASRARLEQRGSKPVYRIKVHSAGEAPLTIDVAAADGRIVASERKDGKHD